MEKNKLTLQIITPAKQVFDEKVDSITLRTVEGDMGIFYNHEPVVALLGYSTLYYIQEGIKKSATHMGGFVEITGDKVVVLTDASEFPEDIDIERAKKAKERAEQRLSQDDMNHIRAEIALKKALVRINLKQAK